MSLVQRPSNEPPSPDMNRADAKEFKFGSTRFLPPTNFESAKRTIEELMLQATTALMRKAMHFEDDHSWELYSQSLDAYEAAGLHLQQIATEMELKKRQLAEDGNLSKAALAEATTVRAWTLLCNCALNLEGMECGLLVAQWPKWHEDVELVRIAANKTFDMAQRMGQRSETLDPSKLMVKEAEKFTSPNPNQTSMEFTAQTPNTLPINPTPFTDGQTRVPTSFTEEPLPDFQVPRPVPYDGSPRSFFKPYPEAEMPVKSSPLPVHLPSDTTTPASVKTQQVATAYEATIIENESDSKEEKSAQEMKASLLRPDSVSEAGHEDLSLHAQASYPHPGSAHLGHEYQAPANMAPEALFKALVSEKSLWELTAKDFKELVEAENAADLPSIPGPDTSSSEHAKGEEALPASESPVDTKKGPKFDDPELYDESLDLEPFRVPAPQTPADVASSSAGDSKGPVWVWNKEARPAPALDLSDAEMTEFSFSLPSRTEQSSTQSRTQTGGRSDVKFGTENKVPQPNVISLDDLKNRFDGTRIVQSSRLETAARVVRPDTFYGGSTQAPKKKQPDGYSRRF